MDEHQRNKKKKSTLARHHRWYLFLIVFTFAMALGFGLVTQTVLTTDSIIICCVIIFVLIAIAFTGDIFAVAVAYADMAHFNAMASRKIRGAKMSIRLIQHSDKVSSILSDILGDVCGIVSGAMGVSLSLAIINTGSFTVFQQGLILASVNATTAMFAITAKSVAKKIAIANSTKIVRFFGIILTRKSKS